MNRKIYHDPKRHLTDAESLATRKSMLFDVVNKQNVQIHINDELGKIPWNGEISRNDKGNEGTSEISPEEMSELYKKLSNNVKVNGRRINSVATQDVIQTEDKYLNNIEPFPDTEETVKNAESKNTKPIELEANLARKLFQPETSSLSYEELHNGPLNTHSSIQMDHETDTPTNPFQEVEEMMKSDKNSNPIPLQLPLVPKGSVSKDNPQIERLGDGESLLQRTDVQNAVAAANQQASIPKMMEFQGLVNSNPRIPGNEPDNVIDINQQASIQGMTEQVPSLENDNPHIPGNEPDNVIDISQQASMQGMAEQVPSLENGNTRIPGNELGNYNGMNQQDSLQKIQEQLLSKVLGNTGKGTPPGLGVFQDTGAGEVVSLGDQEKHNVEFPIHGMTEINNGDFINRVSPSPTESVGGVGENRNMLTNVFNAINGMNQLGDLNNRMGNFYARGSHNKAVHNRLKSTHKELDTSHFNKPPESKAKPKRKRRRGKGHSSQKYP